MSVALINFEVGQNAWVCGNMKASLPDSISISSHFTSEYSVLLLTHISLAIQRLSTVQKNQTKKKTNPTLIVKHFSAVPASWTSMRQNSNTIFPLITHARISGAINWFWELSSIFNPSSGSVGPQWVKTSLQNQNEAGIQHIQGSSKGLEDLLTFDGAKSTEETFYHFLPNGGDMCQYPSSVWTKGYWRASLELCGGSQK